MEQETEFMSLYDYLKRPAGSELGKVIYQAAKNTKTKVTSKIVEHSPHCDKKIMMYPKTFLDGYFSALKVNDQAKNLIYG